MASLVVSSDEKADISSLASKLSASSLPSAGNGEEKSPPRNLPRIFGAARQGAKQFQEDSYCYWQSPAGIVSVAAVYDGHGGVNGAVSSTTCRDQTLSYFAANAIACESWTEDVWKAKLEALFEHLHTTIRIKLLNDDSPGPSKGAKRHIDDKGIVRTSTGDPVHGGTTGTLCCLVRPIKGTMCIISANVGDSTAILIPERGSFSFLTVDHGPENADEFIRVKNLPSDTHPEKLLYVYDKTNVFRKYECPRVFLDDGSKDPRFVSNPWGNGLHPTNVRYEPAVYAVTPRQVSRDTTCIAMTRALGDFYAHQFGLTFQPSITVVKPPSDMRFVVCVASDGIWDCWKYEDLHEFINNKISSLDIEATVEQTLNESILRAITNFGTKHYDDASLVLIEVKM
jgi:serine/threonine protein phosphatase PrpC